MTENKKNKRLSKEQWLAQAIEVVSKRGHARLRIDNIVQKLGVTKGSFYWHFKNREDFVKSLVEFWAEFSTTKVIEMANQVPGEAQNRLWAVMESVYKTEEVKYDITMRAWAAQDQEVARIVKKVDKQRLAYINSLFSEMGFKGEELEMRTRVFVYFMAGTHVFYAPEKTKDMLKQLKERHKFFVRP